MRHIVWDWNGTLFDDTAAVVAATNEIFAPYGVGPLTVRQFREVCTRPIWVCYERLLGRPLRDGEWERLDDAFHVAYARHMDACALTAGGPETLERWRRDGGTQSLLSMLRHDELMPCVEWLLGGRWGGMERVRSVFSRLDGLHDLGAAGGPKAEHLARHLDAIGLDGGDALVVGDTVDDAAAAAHVGARAVLFTGGTHARQTLEDAAVPLIEALPDVLEHAAA